MRKKTLFLALGSIITALSVVIILLTNVITSASFALPAVAGVLTAFLVIETDKKCAFISFIAVSLLSILFVTDKTSVVVYVVFFGHYPILKPVIEKLHSKFIQYIIKYIIFNVCILTAYFIFVKVFMLPEEEFVINGINILIPLYIISNITFLAYDIAVTQLVCRYINKLKPHIDNILNIYK